MGYVANFPFRLPMLFEAMWAVGALRLQQNPYGTTVMVLMGRPMGRSGCNIERDWVHEAHP